MDSERGSDRLHNARLIVLVVGAVAGLCTVLCAVVVLLTAWQQRPVPGRVEAAVHASFPTSCTNPGETILVERSPIHVPLIYDTWDVTCVRWLGPAMMVNVTNCSVTRPIVITIEWESAYGQLYQDGQKMPVCP